jgi:hypothetical protein
MNCPESSIKMGAVMRDWRNRTQHEDWDFEREEKNLG